MTAAVGARDPARAEAWAAEHGVDAAVAGYEAVTDAPDIDAVYVALPNAHHAEWTERALLAGKALLCEKPLCVGAVQTATVLAAAARSGSPLWAGQHLAVDSALRTAMVLDALRAAGRG